MNGTIQNAPTKPIKVGSCLSCGAARNRGDHCHYCDAFYLDTIKQKTNEPIQNSLASKYKISEDKNRLTISWGWRSKTIYFLIPFFVFWNLIAFTMAFAMMDAGNPFSLFPIPGIHILVGIFGPLYIALQLINKTTIVVNRSYLSIRHHPIPWGKSHRFSKEEIGHIFVSKAQRKTKKNSWDVPVLQLVNTNGTRYELLKGSESVEFADYESLRQRISKALDIPLRAH